MMREMKINFQTWGWIRCILYGQRMTSFCFRFFKGYLDRIFKVWNLSICTIIGTYPHPLIISCLLRNSIPEELRHAR